MVDYLGSIRGLTCSSARKEVATKIASSIRRFNFRLIVKEMEIQMEKKYKIFQQVIFPWFNPKREAEYEEYFDKLAPAVNRSRLSVQLMQEGLIDSAIPM